MPDMTIPSTQPVRPVPRLVEVPLEEAQPGDVNVRAWLDGTVVAIVIDDRHYTSPLAPKFGVSSVLFRPTTDPAPVDPDAAALARLERWLRNRVTPIGKICEVGFDAGENMLTADLIDEGFDLHTGASTTLAAAINAALDAAGAEK